MSTPRRASHPLLRTVQSHENGSSAGITSVCSAHPWVLEAALRQASRRGALLCIESTSNQVNQHGGYTGMTPGGFARHLESLMRDLGVDPADVVTGGDHLGPYPWRARNARQAMAEAGELIRRCAEAGYGKLHLDASMACADDPRREDGSLDTKRIAQRTAELCEIAEEASRLAGRRQPLYVIGTEVPAPGGAEADEPEVHPTTVSDVKETVEAVRTAFSARGLHGAWERVAAVVVQPGVEFGDSHVLDYDRRRAASLCRYIETLPGLVYEAHSTDYQNAAALKAMVEDHFVILKVGPALTFAFREAVLALERIEVESLSLKRGVSLSRLGETLESVMVKNPEHWDSYYRGEDAALFRRYGYSDRIRYYWARDEVQSRLDALLDNLSRRPIPLTLISQYLPGQYRKVRLGKMAPKPEELIRGRIDDVLDDYFGACGSSG